MMITSSTKANGFILKTININKYQHIEHTYEVYEHFDDKSKEFLATQRKNLEKIQHFYTIKSVIITDFTKDISVNQCTLVEKYMYVLTFC